MSVALYNDDCLKVMQQLIDDGVKVDAIITDIPYFKVVQDKWDNVWANEIEYLTWVTQFIGLFDKIVSSESSIIMFTGRQYNRKIANILDNYFDEKRIIIWARKRAFNNTRGNALSSGYEPICYYTKGKPVFNNLKVFINSNRKEYKYGYLKDGVSLSDVWTDISALPHNSKEKVDHPTQKPVMLMERCINLVTQKGDLVLDPFMGSGTTGVACARLGRSFIGIELDRKYFKIAEERINNQLQERSLF